ncbi:hypothetical protein B0T40_13565 [Chromobacterium haemolyticum]|nr:hypothetical protein B0T40_13565 [Chromobacterium haemolyticum]
MSHPLLTMLSSRMQGSWRRRRLICLGAMTDLLDWVERITQGDTRYKDFIEQMRQLVRRGELAFLRRFANNSCNPVRAEF